MNGRDRSPASKGQLNPDATPPVHRYPAPADLTDTVRHFWVPEWDLPPGIRVTARVLGYPALNLVVEEHAVIVSGPTSRASERVLEGRGWAVGALLHPAATLALGYDGTALLDRVELLDDPALVGEVTGAMAAGRETGCAALAAWLRAALAPVPPHGLLANRALALVEEDTAITRVADLAARLHVTPRTLERAVRRCTGFTPAEMLRRRRLQAATDRLVREPASDLTAVAAETGYADHAHMTREFRSTIAEPPSRFRGSS
ncbi:MAG TPA: helix-turn-helix domain-containing protein [Marmoricola sp.]|nr:helix-turn-helix domain-containing protein [Marmoricola sp.]